MNQPHVMREMGKKSKEFVRENFLLTHQLREYMILMVALFFNASERIEL